VSRDSSDGRTIIRVALQMAPIDIGDRAEVATTLLGSVLFVVQFRVAFDPPTQALQWRARWGLRPDKNPVGEDILGQKD